MKKLIVSMGITISAIPCLCYYIAKYYIYKTLTFEESMILMFTVFCSLIILGLLLGLFCAYKCIKLSNEIQKLENTIEQYHYDNLEYHENNRELNLDSFNRGDK